MCNPVISNAKKTYVKIKNESNQIVCLPKHAHLADIRCCTPLDFTSGEDHIPNVRKIYDISDDDISHLQHPLETTCTDEDFLSDISFDKQLPATWRTRFANLCRSFSDIITPVPGRYNGVFGRVNTEINFATIPPSNLKTYLPKYSHEMMKTLGQKMDVLESWGVLRKPEDLGIVPEFVVPSMLTPKPEKDQFRLVTDFSSLNRYIKKLPTVSPNVQEAKAKIAKFSYHAFLDLSNYYYQGGVKIQDSQYLATVHPFKGLMVYTVEPQGLLNSGEHAYERLGRIFGDMCADERITRMADGIYVLGNTYGDLFQNLKEVFNRARIANLTFKPSKIEICPSDIVVFGWRKRGNAWMPTQHTTLPLINANKPTTVKQLRSWIGAYKQLSPCIRDYSIPLSRLESLTGSDKSSATRIQWTNDLENDFKQAKAMIQNLENIYTPTPNDHIQTYSDYSEEHKAVGGRMVIVRKSENKILKLNGGYFSARLNGFQTKWLPCKGESLACKLVLEHFRPFIRESKNVVQHFTDSLPCVQAFKRAKLGAFSTSARIATFLTTINSMNVEILHKAGKNIPLVDYISRNPNTCSDTNCQICKFVEEHVQIGDNTNKLNSIQIQDILSGKLNVPFLQRNSWIDVQHRDGTHIKLKTLIANSQAPERRKTKGENTKLKLLHNLYREGKLKLHKDGLITVLYTDQNGEQYHAVSVPTSLFPGVIHALHLKLNHPSKLQLTKLIARHFYSPGYQRIVNEVSDNCDSCAAVKLLPKEIFSESTGEIDGFAANFTADVIERNGQKILIVREKLSSFTMTKFIDNQKADTLKEALISLIIDLIPQSGAVIQVACATAWTALSTQSLEENSDLKKLNIRIDLGRHANKNKNPIIDNACKEFHKEILRLKPEGTPITEIERSIVTANINKRIRKSGLSSREICFRRDLISNNPKNIDDLHLVDEIMEQRKRRHNVITDAKLPPIQTGQNVYLKSDISKLRAREVYVVVETYQKENEPWAIIQKKNSQFRNKKYDVKLAELLPLPGQIDVEELTDIAEEQAPQQTVPTINSHDHQPRRSNPSRQAKTKALGKIANMNSVKTSFEVNNLPRHGFDYEKMMELAIFDDEDTYIVYPNEESPLTLHETTPSPSSSWPPYDTYTDTDTLTIEEEEHEEWNVELPYPWQPPTAPRIPTDLSLRQNLDEQLNLPEIRSAIAAEAALVHLRDQRNLHGEAGNNRAVRGMQQPRNYDRFHETGEKQ